MHVKTVYRIFLLVFNVNILSDKVVCVIKIAERDTECQKKGLCCASIKRLTIVVTARQ